jgi:spermidine/putrescine transport system permease protein
MLLLYLPLGVTCASSFNAATSGAAWKGFTLRWYAELWADGVMAEAAANSLVVAGASTLVSTLLGTALGFGLERFPWSRRWLRGFDALVDLPIVTPDIIFGIGLLLAFRALGAVAPSIELGLGTLVAAHATFQISFVALVVRSRLAALGPEYDEAARDLYAGDWLCLRRITLPLVAPAIVAGALLAFTLSLDDTVVSVFVRGVTRTLPTQMFAEIKKGIRPELHALSTVFFLVTLALVLGLERAGRTKRSEA